MPYIKKCRPIVSIITPVFNSAQYLQETINSIKAQSYKNIEYIVIDGGSTDGTVEIIKSNADVISHWVSESDSGMYDALCKGLRMATGEYIGYLNAGDLYFDKSLETVVNVFTGNNKAKWITSGRTICNTKSVITACDIPFRYKSRLIRKGVYGRFLPFIQQESTFFHRSLLSIVNMNYLSKLKLAGDFFLWYEMSKENNLFIVETQLGIFKKHPGQLSESITQYFDEIDSFCERRTYLDYLSLAFEAVSWSLHPRLRQWMDRRAFVYDHNDQEWKAM
ncbi:glycosyltransferase family 2 protein [Endozoicomonas ascidiicola]|uniref:glycosyltransferase family 2 protein n=1 Tax=Endozoicomonas ascidiicola TaxID=1698521 RepID=UPI00082D4256|nr:glycosyltransferase family 2 protein [Endozoicomonas ascidiicola]